MDKAVELTYSYEMPNGLFRKTVRYYNENLIRELLVNSLAHSSRTISNDITIKVYPGYICISNPGGLPLGVTKDNIQVQSVSQSYSHQGSSTTRRSEELP